VSSSTYDRSNDLPSGRCSPRSGWSFAGAFNWSLGSRPIHHANTSVPHSLFQNLKVLGLGAAADLGSCSCSPGFSGFTEPERQHARVLVALFAMFMWFFFLSPINRFPPGSMVA